MAHTPAPCNLVYEPRRYRRWSQWGLVILCAASSCGGLGVLGLALVCVVANRYRRALHDCSPGAIRLQGEVVSQAWMTKHALCVVQTGTICWLFRDECSPAQWARVRRYLTVHTPKVVLGLSMSR